MTVERIHINPETINWAIRRAGFDADVFFKKNAKVKSWVYGDSEPTVKQLQDFAERVHVPFGFLFLVRLPEESIPIPFFRTVGSQLRFNLKLYDTILDLKRKQDWLSEYIAENELEQADFIGSCVGKSVDETVFIARRKLGISSDWAFGYSNSASVIRDLISKLENVGCIVSVQGYVGSNNKRKVDVSDCRGFALIDRYAPFIYVNNNDNKEAQFFTLIHEFAHLLIAFSSGYGSGSDNDDHREQFCDQVAASFLVDGDLLMKVWNGSVEDIAHRFRVSKIMMARRAHECNLLGEAAYRDFMDAYWANAHLYTADNEKVKKGGGDFYATTRRRLGFNFLVHLRNAVNSSQLSYKDAYRLTGCYSRTFDKLISNERL